jgi:hypothetical protein
VDRRGRFLLSRKRYRGSDAELGAPFRLIDPIGQPARDGRVYKLGERPTRLMPSDPDNSGSIFIDNSRADSPSSAATTATTRRQLVAASPSASSPDDWTGPAVFGTYAIGRRTRASQRRREWVRAGNSGAWIR